MLAILKLVSQLHGGLRILGADFNLEPELLQAHPLFDELNCEVISPSRATCVTSSSWRRYDYFLMAKPAEGLIEDLRVLDELVEPPHPPVARKLSVHPPALFRWKLKQPARLPVDPPIGCAQAPPCWPVLPLMLDSSDHACEVWEKIAHPAEQEILDKRYISGKDRNRYAGYDRRPQWVQVQVLPLRLKNRRYTIGASLWRSAARRFKEAWLLLYKHVYLPSWGLAEASSKALEQLLTVRRVLLKLATQLCAGGDPHFVQGSWADKFRATAWCVPWSGHELPIICCWVKHADGIATLLEKADMNASTVALRSMISLASAAQASWLHRMPKEKVTWQALRSVGINQRFTPIDVAEEQRTIWAEVWRCEDEQLQALPRPWESSPIEPEADANMTFLTVPMFEQACKMIKKRTGLGSDYFHPRHWLHLSDTGKRSSLGFIELIESSAHWPIHASYIPFPLNPQACRWLAYDWCGIWIGVNMGRLASERLQSMDPGTREGLRLGQARTIARSCCLEAVALPRSFGPTC
jgi:hypothetical protein